LKEEKKCDFFLNSTNEEFEISRLSVEMSNPDFFAGEAVGKLTQNVHPERKEC
jgi:hypothetical protein